jgi:hypothetical protein
MCSFKDLMKNDSPIGGAANVAKEARDAQSSDALNRRSAKCVSLGKIRLWRQAHNKTDVAGQGNQPHP